MKKIISICISIILVLSIVACGGAYRVSDVAVEYGNMAIENSNAYLDGELSPEETKRRLSTELSSIERFNEEQQKLLSEEEYNNLYGFDHYVMTYIKLIISRIDYVESGIASKNEVKDLIKTLKGHVK